MKVGALTGKALSNKGQASNAARYQEGDGYLNDLRLESFGHLLDDYILAGAEINQDSIDKKSFQVQEGVISFNNQLWRAYGSRFRTFHVRTIYYVGFLLGQGYVTGTTKPVKDYLPLWEIETDENGNVQTLTDLRGEIGRVKFKAAYDGVYLNTSEVQNAIDIASNLKPLGEYDNSSTYQMNNVVSKNGRSYLAKKETTGNSPADGASNAHWQLLSDKGDVGPQGPQGIQGDLRPQVAELDLKISDVHTLNSFMSADFLPQIANTLVDFDTIIQSNKTAAELAKSIAEYVEKRFDQVIAEAGSNNPEVVDARGKDINLNARISKMELGTIYVGETRPTKKSTFWLDTSKYKE